MNKRERVRAQVKSRWYYSFWGAATVAVVAGQIYVGTSYRAMSRSLHRWFEETIDIMQEPVRQRRDSGIYTPLVPPPSGDFRDYGNGVVFLSK